ncbi:uncharacterized protein LOC106130742 [Amyelois transitella]|uniref:uncharacterized protein LOC106130742 n=1 Tax=Amyelois transitella TaxID=680683 RepID=UPI00299007FC|nr:uncharacterized protein LOC106130742 [Amyelois transitella]
MEDSEDNMSAEDIKPDINMLEKPRPKKRSLVERELETNLTARITSPISNAEASSTSRYGRARKLKIDPDIIDVDKIVIKREKTPTIEKTPVKIHSPVYRMHASNSPMRLESPKGTPYKATSVENNLENQIENIYHENISLSRFGSEEKKITPNKLPKVYVRKDLIQNREEDEESVLLIKNLFSPTKSGQKSNSHINNILERSSEKYGISMSQSKSQNGYTSVVKTLDFDSKKKRKDSKDGKAISKSELFEMEAKCEYQVGDLAWSRMGTYPFWPCIVTREPSSGMFVRRKLFGRIERDVIHVTFFGDNGRRGWIVDTMLRKFLGQLEFEAAREQFTPADKKKDPRLYAAFFISEKKQPQWNVSVEEAELLLREPKRLRIDLLNDMLMKGRVLKTTKQNKSGKITRTASDVSLSESLYDTLFSEDDGKEDSDRLRNKSRNKSLDVSEVVTACLDNMAAKTGNIKIQRQSHMDRWLQKAKSKTPEKSQARLHVVPQKVEKKETKVSAKKNKKSQRSSLPLTQKPYSFRNSPNQSQNMLAHHVEHDYNAKLKFAPSLNSTLNDTENDSDDNVNIGKIQGFGVIAKMETLSDSANESMHNDEEIIGDHLEKDVIKEEMDIDRNDNIINENEISNDTQSSKSEHIVNDSNEPMSSIESISIYSTEKNDRIIVSEDQMDLGNNKLDTPPIARNKVNDDPENISPTTMHNSSTDESDERLFNKLVNGDHEMTELSTKDSDISSKELEISQDTEESQEENANNLNTSLETESAKKKLYNPDFLKYLELRQDDLMDQYPELSYDEIVEYLHKTWLYDEHFSDGTKTNNDFKQSESAKGSKQSKSRSKRRQTRKTKQRITLNKSAEINDFIDENETVDRIEETLETTKIISNSCVEVPNKINATEKSGDNSINMKINRQESDNINIVKDFEEISTISDKQSVNEIISNGLDPEQETVNIKIAKKSDYICNAYKQLINKIIPNEQNTKQDVSVNDFSKLKTLEGESYANFSKDEKDPLREDMDVSCSDIRLYENDEVDRETSCLDRKLQVNENKTAIEPETENRNDQFCSNSNTREVNVSEKSEVVISNKEQEAIEPECEKENRLSSVTPDMLYDDSSCESIDISYAISPLSVKMEEPDNEDFTNILESNEDKSSQDSKCPLSEKNNEQNIENKNIPDSDEAICYNSHANEFSKMQTMNGMLDDAHDKNKFDQDTTCAVISKEINEKEPISEVQLKTDNNVPDVVKNTNIDIPIEVKMNGTHISKIIEDLEGDNSSLHSEDSEPLSVTRNKLKLKEKQRVNRYADRDFIIYLEMRQDDIAHEHPELNQAEIVEYLYKTWLYEENAKSDIRKTDEVQQSILIKGPGENKQASKKRKPRESKEKKNETQDFKENNDVDTASIKSEGSTSLKRWLRPKRYTSKLYADFDSSRDTSPVVTDETVSVYSLESEEYRTNNSTPNDEILKPETTNTNHNKLTSKTKTLLMKSNDIQVDKAEPEFNNGDSGKGNDSNELSEIINGNNKTEIIEQIKEEFDPEISSIKSEDSGVSSIKRKQKSKFDKSVDDPEFAKYLELRQDALIDENPQLAQDEIVSYLYKTWLYEESVKSDIKKTDEIEQSNLVKGINPDYTMPLSKRVKRKIKIETVNDPVQSKPKRKTIRLSYNEEYPDFEDEIAMFEIMKNSPTVELNKMDVLELKAKEIKAPDNKTEEDEETVIEIPDEVDEVELYFAELTKPKPNVFKGLLREKVCEICEKVGCLVKCKGCNGMFHMDCVKNEIEVVDKVSAPSRGRKKKKKKPGRKPKNLDDSGSMSDEKSQDVSAENMSVDENIDLESHTFDAENFEAQLSAKMKELLDSTEKEIHYDSYSSDDGIDWDNSVAGKCEIVDVVLKPKSQNVTDFKCNNCQKYDSPVCFVCKKAVSKTGVEHRQRCQVAHCHKYYHLECLDHWPQTQFTSSESRNKKTNEVFESHMCPRHVCHTCVSDDPRGCKTRFSGDKLARCVRCPATYHSFTKCLPAGTQILTGSHIICPRHYQHRPGKVPCHVNTGWCFICALGGTLICCEYCPTSFHAECLNISPPEGNYMCEDCETGRLPLYGEMVWVKLGHYRWWPGIILHPSEIPENIMAVKHSQGEFVVRFFGQYDHYWVNRGRVFPFQEGDSGKISSQKSKIDAAFTTAMEHAQRACQILKNAHENEEESLDIASSLLPPHYVKLKVNKPCGSLVSRRGDVEEGSLTQCECDPAERDPCGPYSQCLNRMLLTECGPICRAGDRCNNRAFEKRLYPKLVPYRTPHRGWGLKTLEDIKAGQFVIEYVGELIDEEEFKRRMARKHEIRDENFYFLTLDKERMIDAGPKGNLARFMNHCCEPNCETQKWTVLGDVRVGLFAIHDIPANSEVTFNYLLECASIDKKKCMCGAKRCAGYIGAKPKQDESQPKKGRVAAKRTCRKRKNMEESPSTKNKIKKPVGRPAKPKELTEIEKDLLIIKSATNGLSSDSECSRVSSLEGDRHSKALKRKRVSFSTEDVILNGNVGVKKLKADEDCND